MRRSLLTLLLLLNYLLVVCASVAERASPPVARPFAYVHHHDCQLRNSWRGGAIPRRPIALPRQVPGGDGFLKRPGANRAA